MECAISPIVGVIITLVQEVRNKDSFNDVLYFYVRLVMAMVSSYVRGGSQMLGL